MQFVKVFGTESWILQAEIRRNIVAIIAANRKGFNILGDEIIEIYAGNTSANQKIRIYDEKLLEELRQKQKNFLRRKTS